MIRHLIFAAILCLCAPTWADYAEVRRVAIVRTEASSDSLILFRAQPGQNLVLVNPSEGQTNGYYRIQSPNGLGEGFVHRSRVRLHRGSPTTSTVSGAQSEAEHLRLGRPMAEVVLRREAYVVGLDARLKIPAWVQYTLTREDLGGTAVRRDDYRRDWDPPVPAQPTLEDYAGSGVDRGHMAPAEDMTRSDEVMSESFLLTNMSPQMASFNRGRWKVLESDVRDWVKDRGELTVIMGPIFDVIEREEGADTDAPINYSGTVTYHVIGEGAVAVPTAFFKVVVDVTTPNEPKAIAFIMPNRSLADRDLEEFLVSIDEIERRTGLDLLSAMPEDVQNVLEREPADALWVPEN